MPGSRLLIEGKNLDRPDFAQAYRDRCERLGLPPAQLDLVALRNDNQYLTYHRIDIALDPFPLTGGTTTFDVLWMGLPVVSMVGESFKSRMGVGLLAYLGRSEWLAETDEDYVRIAAGLATDVEALNTLRLGLRGEVEASALMREDVFNHHFAEGLRVMWLQWLARAEHPSAPEAQAQAIQEWLPPMPEAWTPAPGARRGFETWPAGEPARGPPAPAGLGGKSQDHLANGVRRHRRPPDHRQPLDCRDRTGRNRA